MEYPTFDESYGGIQEDHSLNYDPPIYSEASLRLREERNKELQEKRNKEIQNETERIKSQLKRIVSVRTIIYESMPPIYEYECKCELMDGTHVITNNLSKAYIDKHTDSNTQIF